MKKILTISLILLVVLLASLAVILVPKFRNMASEYHTARAIHDLELYIEKSGEWPSDASQLFPNGTDNSGIYIDYSVTIARLRENRDLLAESIRPISGKFYTYPHYEADIERLREVICRQE